MDEKMVCSTRKDVYTDALELSKAQILTLADGLKSGMFLVQKKSAPFGNYVLFSEQKDTARIDGMVFESVDASALKPGENVIKRVSRGIVVREVIEAANGVKLNDEAVSGASYKTLLEKQGFEIANM